VAVLPLPLSYREVEELMLQRGVIVSYETIRRGCAKFGQAYANGLRRRRPRPGGKWHLDEVFVRTNGELKYPWRAVDQDGNEVDILVRIRRDKAAARRFFRRGDVTTPLAVTLGIPALTDLGHENAGPGFRHPAKKPQGRELDLKQKAFNKVIRGIHGVAERAPCSRWSTAAPPERRSRTVARRYRRRFNRWTAKSSRCAQFGQRKASICHCGRPRVLAMPIMPRSRRLPNHRAYPREPWPLSLTKPCSSPT
jgi:hypothetical protein